MKTTRSGKIATASSRCLSQSALLPYLGATASGRGQRVRRENDSLDRFLIVLTLVREPEPGQQLGDGGVMYPHTLCVGQRIAQLKKRDVGALGGEVFKESLMRGQLPLTRGGP